MKKMFAADRVLINGKIVTLDRNDSIVEAVAKGGQAPCPGDDP